MQDPSSLDPYIWMGVGAVVLTLLVLAFAYLLLAHNQALFQRRLESDVFRRIDDWLARRMPGVWRRVRARFSLQEWHGLALTASALVFFGALYLFARIAVGWRTQARLYEIDQLVHEQLAGRLSPAVIAFFDRITYLGGVEVTTGVGLLLVVVLWRKRHFWRLRALLLTVGVGQLVLFALKWSFGRARPEGRLVDAGAYSFPSGHSFSAMVLYGFLIFLIWRITPRKRIRLPLTLALGTLIFLVGASRIVLSVHWVSDVAGGLILGLAWLISSLLVVRAWQAARSTTPAR